MSVANARPLPSRCDQRRATFNYPRRGRAAQAGDAVVVFLTVHYLQRESRERNTKFYSTRKEQSMLECPISQGVTFPVAAVAIAVRSAQTTLWI